MAQTAQTLTEEQIPAGGIADFVMSDEEISALEAEEAREEFGENGIAYFEPIAKRMASYGRFGDDQVVHAETGELVVPRALIDQSPELKESIFSHLREMGIEDPDRYVVGSGANSINPETGLPEFFFKKVFSGVKKAVSGVAKGVSKAFKSVGKVLKKIAPVILPIVGTLAFGPIYGAALGSGIGTLIQGGNLKDALKSALISGATGAVTAGVGSKMSGGTFVGGVKDAANTANLAAGFDSLGKAAGGDFSGFSTANMKAGPASKGGTAYTAPTTPAAAATPAQVAQADLAAATEIVPDVPDTFGATGVGADQYLPTDFAETPMFKPEVPVGDTRTLTQKFLDTDVGSKLYSGAMDVADTTGEFYRNYLSPSRDMGQLSITDALGELGVTPANATAAQLEVAKEMVSKAAPGLIRTYAPLAAAGGALAYGAGFFDAPPVEDPNLVQRNADGSVTTGADLIAQDPDKYLLTGPEGFTPQYAQGQFEVQSPYTIMPGGQIRNNPFYRPRPEMYAAAGGEVYPRRNGGIMPNEGIPDQDSVRALLMPGEFVMTKDAVRGLGNGSLNQGINNMYSMMRNLETKGRAA